MARSSCNRSMEPVKARSGAPNSFVGSSNSSPLTLSSKGVTVMVFLRRRIRTVFTDSRCNQVENAESPRNVWILRNTCKNASWVNSSASAVFPIIRRHRQYTRRLCRLKSASNAVSSPLWARVTSSALDKEAGVDLLSEYKNLSSRPEYQAIGERISVPCGCVGVPSIVSILGVESERLHLILALHS